MDANDRALFSPSRLPRTLAAGMILTTFFLGGCSGDPTDTPTPTGSGTPTGSATPTETPTDGISINALQDLADPNHPAEGTVVHIYGVIVTGVRYDGTIFIGEPEGGAYSGIYVFQPDGATYIPSTIAVGDEIDIVGEYDIAFGANQIAMFGDETFTPSVTVKSSGNTLPPAVSIGDPATIATPCDSSTSGVDAYKYEGVRVTLSNVDVTDLNPCDQGNFGTYEIEDTLWVDDDLDPDYAPTEVGEKLTSVTGVLHYAFDHYRVFPNPGDVIPEGGLPTPSETPTPGNEPCTTINTLQDDSDPDQPAEETLVKLCDVIVTATNRSGDFYVQEAAGGPYSGIFVFHGNVQIPTVAVGDKVDVVGKFIDYFGAYQVSMPGATGAGVTVTSSGNTLPAAVVIEDVSRIATPCGDGNLVDGPDAREHEGVRVTFSGVQVTAVDVCGDEDDFGAFEVEQSLWIDDDLGMDYEPVLDATLTSVTGIVHYSFDHYRVFPSPGGIDAAE